MKRLRCLRIVSRHVLQISRVSLANVHRLRDEAVELLALCKLNKAEVLLRTLLGKQWRYDELFHDSRQAVPGGVASALRDYQRQMQVHRFKHSLLAENKYQFAGREGLLAGRNLLGSE